jgi:predicted outer membrane repeat protein
MRSASQPIFVCQSNAGASQGRSLITRILSRWLMSVALAVLALVAINMLVATSPVQGRPTAALINCSGSIQACIDTANDGDTILIAAGRYTESLTLSKPVSLTGVSSDTTIIHAMAGQRVLIVTGATISNSVVISGLTFTGGNLSGEAYCPEACGGGMLVTDGAQVTIQNATFSNNAASGAGGGLYDGGISGDPTAATLIDSQFVSNTAAYDGGGVASDGSITLIGGQFIHNTSQGRGGGLGVGGQYNPTFVLITGTRFINNAAFAIQSDGLGGGVWVGGTAIVVNGYFEGNVSHGSNGGGLFASTFIITDTDFVSNAIMAGWGGGASGNEATISSGRFERNSSGGAGGGISVNYASVDGTDFISNTSNVVDGLAGGGGVFVVFQGDISNARFESNQCPATGCSGGGTLFWGGPSRIVNTILLNNTAASDGTAIAIDVPGENAFQQNELAHLTIAGSTFITMPAVAVFSGTVGITDTIIASHTIAVSNTGGIVREDYNLFFDTVTNTVGVTSGGHSLGGDPKFVDPLNGDYHLQFGSAGIDRGVDAGVYVDLDGNPRPVGAGFDIGAYEYQAIKVLYLPLIRR